MRTRHTPHSLHNFPVFSSSFLSEDELVLGGGGGTSRAGIKNKLRLYKVGSDREIELTNEFEMEQGEDAPMSMAAHNKTSTIVCGINSAPEKLKDGLNANCRVFTVNDQKISLLNTHGTLSLKDDSLDYQKVTVLSPDGTLLAVAGAYDFSLLSYPSLLPVAHSIHTKEEIYDATFSSATLVITTTNALLVYAIPTVQIPQTPSPAKNKGKGKKAKAATQAGLMNLDLLHSVKVPAIDGNVVLFRSARFHPLDPDILYSAVNATSPRKVKSKTIQRQAYIYKWNTKTWTTEKMRKVSDKGLTCFAISSDGKFLGLGTSELALSLLEANTLSPLVTILKAHGMPPTTMCFNPTASLLVSASADIVRIVTVPQSTTSSPSWAVILLILATLLLAILVQKYLNTGIY